MVGSVAKPVRLDPWHVIKEVGWGGQLAVCTIDQIQSNAVYDILVTEPDRAFTETVNYDEIHPPAPGPDDYLLVRFPSEDDTAVPKNAWDKVPAVWFAGLRANDKTPILVDPGGADIWQNLGGVFKQYETHAEKYDGGAHERSNQYIVGGIDMEIGLVFGAPGDPGLFIGDDAFELLYPDDPIEVLDRPPNWANDTLHNLQTLHPTNNYRLSVTSPLADNPSGKNLLLQYQVGTHTLPHYVGWDRAVFLVNLSKAKTVAVRMDHPGTPPPGAPDTVITVEIFGQGQVDLHSNVGGPPPPPPPPDPVSADFAQHVRVRFKTPSRSFTRSVAPSSSGEVARFNNQGFV